jgi:hypothetical protein
MNDFDAAVIAAMARWPDVPAVYGWLRLDRRGQWHLIDRGRPDFDPARDGLGSPISSPPILDFIARNYGVTEDGAWFWQNGPQRVFVDLDLAPRILRLLGEQQASLLVDHTGRVLAEVDSARIDADGRLWLSGVTGFGAVHDLDLAAFEIHADATDQLWLRWAGRLLPIAPIADPASVWGFQPRPRGHRQQPGPG